MSGDQRKNIAAVARGAIRPQSCLVAVEHHLEAVAGAGRCGKYLSQTTHKSFMAKLGRLAICAASDGAVVDAFICKLLL